MPFLLIFGVLLLALFMSGSWWFVNANTAQLKLALKRLAIVALIALGLLLLVTGKLVPAIGVLGIAATWAVRLMAFRDLFVAARRAFGRTTSNAGANAPPAARGTMTREEALAVLGLTTLADPAEIKAAHRRLIQGLHPDVGGSDYLAAKINQARDVLLHK
jgi:hypothetical protein